MIKKIIPILLFVLLGCEQPIEYVEVIEYETIIETETVIEYVDKEITVTEYVDVVETVTEYVDIEIPIEVEVIEYVDRVETITEYVDHIETVIEYVEVETIIEVPVEVIITETVVEYVDRVETITEYVDRIETVTEYVDNIVYTETIVYLEKEIYTMPEVEPIKEYENYITTENKVHGVYPDGWEEIPLIKGLFKIDGVIYFSIDDKFYSQVDEVITEIESFPAIPESEHIEFANYVESENDAVDGQYKIEIGDYNGDSISKVFNGTQNPNYMQIDGACMRGADLLYSVSISYGSTPAGIYLWTVNGNPTRQSVIGEGRIW